MAKIGEFIVPVNFAITENSKAVLRPLIAEVMREALEGVTFEVALTDEGQACIHAEVDRALERLLSRSGESHPER